MKDRCNLRISWTFDRRAGSLFIRGSVLDRARLCGYEVSSFFSALLLNGHIRVPPVL